MQIKFFLSKNKMITTIIIIVILVAFVIPLFVKRDFYLSLLIPGMIYSVVCMGWTTIMKTGRFSLGQAGVMAVGGYASAIFTVKFGMSVWAALILAGIVSSFICFFLGKFTLRLQGLYFVIVTFSFCEITRVVGMNWVSVFGGARGLNPPHPDLSMGSFVVSFSANLVPYYYLALAFLIVSALVFWKIDSSRLGRIFRSIEVDDILSEHVGIHPMKYRMFAFVIAGFFTGIAGAILVHFYAIVCPSSFTLWDSIMILIISTVGGTGSAVTGPIVGAMLLTPLGDYLTKLLPGAKSTIFGGLVVLVAFYLPEGLIGLPKYFYKLKTLFYKTKF